MRRASALRIATLCGVGACLAIAVAVPAAAVDESISAHVTTSHPMVGQDLDIAGQVTGAASSMSTITVTRDDGSGTGTSVGMPVTTDDQGNFTVQDTPPARGQVTYHLSADAGAATTDVSTTVAGKPANLTISVSPAPADAESSVRVVARLGSATTNRDVTLYARPYQGSKQQFDSGPVDANGHRTADRTVHRRTTFIAVFSGDSAFAPTQASKIVRVRAVVREHLKGGYATSGGRRLYHANDNPVIHVQMLPAHNYACVRFRAQHRRHGHWVKSAVSGCAGTDGSGRVIGTFRGPDHVVGVPYRLRAEWHGNKAVASRHGEWLNLEFR